MSENTPSLAVKLCGTTAEDTRGRTLTAGDLSVELDNGSLRYVRFAGVEILRGIAFLVRDENWGTFPAEIYNLTVAESEDGFEVGYTARCGDASRDLSYSASIRGQRAGRLEFEVEATPRTDFLTNRTGFVVLHPIEGCTGRPVDVLHVDGTRERSTFPEIINPLQPFYDLRALTHEPVPGVRVTCEMTGDTFEMEDHRNWTDASYKTYCRPLALPWPYTLEAGKPVKQAVTLEVGGGGGERSGRRSGSQPCTVVVGATSQATMPEIGLGVPADEVDYALSSLDLLEKLGVDGFVLQFDPRRGHGQRELAAYRSLMEGIRGKPVLEVVLPCDDTPAAELGAIAREVSDSGLRLSALEVSPAADLKAVLPGSAPPEVPPLEAVYAAAKHAFPGVRLGGGTFAFFTELNRKRPPVDLLDYVKFTTGPITHAADDRSVMETLSALPYVTRSVREFLRGRSYHVGPSGIGARDNPYGASVTPNPDNQRLCLAEMDPRQRGLFGAAWTLGYVGAFARGGAASVNMNAPTGPRGVIYRRTDYAQPFFDDAGGDAVYPLYHVLADLAQAGGAVMLGLDVSAPTTVAAVGCERSDGSRSLWLANLTDRRQAVSVEGTGRSKARVRRLDAERFAVAVKEPVWYREDQWDSLEVGRMELDAYAVLRIDMGE